jgi:hypothetical protein
MASPNSSNADVPNLTEPRGALDGADKIAREGTQHPLVQPSPQHLGTNPPAKSSPPGYGPYGLPLESAQPLRHLHEMVSRLVRYDGEFPLNVVDGVDRLDLDPGTKADLRDRFEAFLSSVSPMHPYLAVLKKQKEDEERGVDGEREAQQDKQPVGDLASKGKDHTHARMEEALYSVPPD